MAEGEKVVCRDLVCWASPSLSGNSRLGLIVSKKVGNAVCRNRVKRVLRDIFRQWGKPLDKMDVVVLARWNSKSVGYLEFKREFIQSLHRLMKRLSHTSLTKAQDR